MDSPKLKSYRIIWHWRENNAITFPGDIKSDIATFLQQFFEFLPMYFLAEKVLDFRTQGWS
jgi:hypothetical protein